MIPPKGDFVLRGDVDLGEWRMGGNGVRGGEEGGSLVSDAAGIVYCLLVSYFSVAVSSSPH